MPKKKAAARTSMVAVPCRFKRKAGSAWEYGVGVGTDQDFLDIIVPFEGRPPRTLWTFQAMPHVGLLAVSAPVIYA